MTIWNNCKINHRQVQGFLLPTLSIFLYSFLLFFILDIFYNQDRPRNSWPLFKKDYEFAHLMNNFFIKIVKELFLR
jgi:hypothetical protein